MAEEFVRLVKIGIDQSFLKENIASADRLAESIDELNKIKKEEGKLTSEQEGRLKALKAERNKNLQVIKQANLLTSEQIKGQEKLKAQLSVLTAQYNKLTTEEQKNTKEGQRLQKQIKGITDELKANEKAVGNNRRNVGNYREDIEAALEATGAFSGGLGGMVSSLKAARTAALAFLATPIGAVMGALAIVIGTVVGAFQLMSESLNRTEKGSAALSKITGTVSAVFNGLLKVLEPLAFEVLEAVADGFDKAGKAANAAAGFLEDGLRFFGLDEQADSVNKFTKAIDESVEGSRRLADAQVELNKINREQNKLQLEFQNRAEKLRQIRDDESRSIEERKQANVELGQLLDEQSQKELELANRSLEIAKMRAQVQGESTENLDAIAEAETKVFEIEERINGQRSEQMTNINSLIREERQLIKEAAANREKDAKEALKAEKEKEESLRKSYQEERALIDEQAELQKAQAEIEIANAEERAERIRLIEQEALWAKIQSIDDETAAYTASADMIGVVDEEKYAKQLTERAKFEAQMAALDREAKQEAYVREMESMSLQEQLELQSAELSIENTEELEKKKNEIALKYLNLRLQAMKSFANEDGIISDQEKKDLQDLEIAIDRLTKKIEGGGEDADTSIAGMIGLSPEDIESINEAVGQVTNAINAVQGIINANAERRLQQVNQQEQAEIAAIQKSGASEEDKEKKITKVEQNAAKERYKIELAQFKTAKALQIALAVANTATAVMAQLSNPTPYAGFVLAALAAATGAIQIGTIAAQQPPPPPQFATGGYVSGAGTGTSDSIHARLSNGESVNNAKTTAMFAPILSAMNKAGGGVDWYKGEGFSKGGIVQKFAAGGIAMSSQAIMRQNEATREVQQTILQTPPVLVIEEFQSVQGRQVRTEQNLQV